MKKDICVDFDGVLNIYKAYDNKFPGFVGYYKKAAKIAQKSTQNHTELKEFLDYLKQFESSNKKIMEILKFCEKHGKEFDITI